MKTVQKGKLVEIELPVLLTKKKIYRRLKMVKNRFENHLFKNYETGLKYILRWSESLVANEGAFLPHKRCYIQYCCSGNFQTLIRYNYIFESAAMWVLSNCVNETPLSILGRPRCGNSKFTTITDSVRNIDARSRNFLCWYLEVVKSLLKKFATDQSTAEFDAAKLHNM